MNIPDPTALREALVVFGGYDRWMQEETSPDSVGEITLAEAMRTIAKAAELALSLLEAEHVYEVSYRSIAVQHPLRCRLDGKALLDCPEGNAALNLPGPPMPPGRYVATYHPESKTFADWRSW